MNDDQLRSHLERRSRIVEPAPELLPAIRSQIDSRPIAVGGSRGGAMAGLAMASALIVLVVLALPRAPAPAAPTDQPPPAASPSGAAPSQDAGRAFGCHSPVDHRYEPSIVDQTGRVVSCTFKGQVSGEIEHIPPQRPRVSNPDGDLAQLRITWFGTPCDAAAQFVFRESPDGLSLETHLPTMDCDAIGLVHALVLELDGDVGAARVAVSDPALVASDAAWWELAAHERPTPESTEIDVVVHERACAGGHSPGGRIVGPQVEYHAVFVSIEFSVTPLAGEGDCPLAPGAPITVQLPGPLGDRRLVDGDGLAGDVTIERTEDFLALATHRVDEYASERFEAMFGTEGCTVTSTTDRYVPTDAELQAAVEALRGSDGDIPGGGYVSEDWLSAARSFGAVEAYAGRPKPWYILTSHEGSPALRSISPTTVAGRTVWFPSDHARLPNRDCEQPQPTPTPSPTTETQESFECVGPPLPPGETPEPGPLPRVIDETGLVNGCIQTDALVDGSPETITVSNPFGENAIQIEWPTGMCDGGIAFTFRAAASGYELIGDRPSECEEPVGSLPIYITFDQPVPADQVTATLVGDEGVPMRTYDCSGAPVDSGNGAVSFVDHSGAVKGCSVEAADYQEQQTLQATSDPSTLRLYWPVPCAGDAWRTQISLWPREYSEFDDPAPRASYVLTVKRIEPLGNPGCAFMMTGRQVSIELNYPIDPSDIEVALITDGRGSSMIQNGVGAFTLSLVSEKLEYRPDEPIDVHAELLYEGGVSPLSLSGVFSLVNGIGIEQLDGKRDMVAGWADPCVRHELVSGEPLVVPYSKSGGWSADDPDADFYREWLEDPVLSLPEGTWLVTAYSQFTVGSECGGERVDLQASIVIEVR